MNPRPRNSAVTRVALAVGVILVLAGALAAALAGLGHRWDWWAFTTGFVVLRWAVYATVAGLAFSVVATVGAVLAKRRLVILAALPAIALAAAVLSVPLGMWYRATHVPPIHDISTDLVHPPAFVALRSVRDAAPNGVAYPGEATARLQQEAYPSIKPLRLAAKPKAVFTAADQVARDMGWHVVAAEPAQGRIEAVARTFWFGFYDDIVIRITVADDGHTQVDVRSASRVGRSDLGTNARRVGEFLRLMRARF
jgi:uncharacterized protein (DUF1499 family)